MIEVKSFKDREGNKVVIGDMIGYFHGAKLMQAGRVVRITKAGYHISVFIDGQPYPWYKAHVEKLEV